MEHMDTNLPPAGNDMDSAETWLARLHSPECTDAERTAYARWRHEHPDAATACGQAERIHALSAALADDPWMRAAARSARRGAQAWHVRHAPRFAWVAVAALVLLVAGGLLWRDYSTPAVQAVRYATTIGEQRTLYLDDGTVMVLDTDSAVTVRFGSARRAVDLDRGRVQFEVARDTGRPFLVHAGAGVIRDIGTRFQVSQRGDDVTVTLLSGVVNVSLPATQASSTLAPGQQVSYAGGRMGAVRGVDLAVARGWTHGEMVFQDRSLADLLAEMNRYSTEQLQLGDPALAKLRISGVFHAGDQASLVQALRLGWGLRAERKSPQIVVLEPASRH